MTNWAQIGKLINFPFVFSFDFVVNLDKFEYGLYFKSKQSMNPRYCCHSYIIFQQV